MSCRTIVGALGKKMKLIEYVFTPDTTAFAAGDAFYGATTSPIIVTDVFDGENGNARVVEFSVTNRHATTVTKKGISVYLFSQAPSSATVAINGAEDINAIDFGFLCGKVSVVTADYADTTFSGTTSEVVTAAIKTTGCNVFNDSTSDKRALWLKIVTDEAATYSSSGLINLKIWIECY